MSNWDYDLAGMFKQRDNPKTKMGPMIGKVVSTNPPVVTIQDGKYTIQGEQLYVAYHLLERKSTYTNMSQSGNISINCHPCKGSYTASCTGDIQLEEVWKPNDLVIVLPDEKEQHFFVIDIIRPLKGCNSHAE